MIEGINSNQDIRKIISKRFFCSPECAEKAYSTLEKSGLDVFYLIDDLESAACQGFCPVCFKLVHYQNLQKLDNETASPRPKTGAYFPHTCSTHFSAKKREIQQGLLDLPFKSNKTPANFGKVAILARAGAQGAD